MSSSIMLDHGDQIRLNEEGWKVCVMKSRNTSYGLMCKWNPESKSQILTKLHRWVIGAKPGQMVAHLNGNGLDCRRCNLALANHSQNGSSIRAKNYGASSKYRGVHIKNGRGKKWNCMFWDSGTCVYLGRFDIEEDAARAYDKEAKARFGQFAHLNFP